MNPPPEIAVIVSTFERPGHLARCLHSLACQQGVDGAFEVVVTDDGSRDGTTELVDRFASEAAFPVRWVTQPQEGFRLARCRNNGVRASRAEYLLFTDGDCVFAGDHLARHLSARKEGVARAGDCWRLDQATSEKIDHGVLSAGRLTAVAGKTAAVKMGRAARKARFHQLLGSRVRPKLVGANIAVWRSDFERVNGFDESFVGWGCEDDDFARRLRLAGTQIRTILDRTFAYHLWHPPHATTPAAWRDGANVQRLRKASRLSRCLSGLRPRGVRDLAVRVVNRRCRWHHWAWPNGAGPNSAGRCEVELLVLPGDGDFRGDADCRVVVLEEGADLTAEVARRTDLVIRAPRGLRTPEDLFAELGRALNEAA